MTTHAFAPARQFLIWKLCAWAGPVYLVGSLASWALLAGFVPPPRADWPLDRLVAFYTDNSLRIRAGMMLTLNFQALWVVWSLAVSRVMRRVEGENGLLSSLYVLCSILNWVIIALALGTVFLLDRRPVPLVPAWVCWLSFAAAVLIFSDTLIPFFASGPFSWHGVISFWMEYPMYFFWIVPVSYYILKAIARLEREAHGQ